MRADEHKDVRWFSFYDHTSSWNRRFHLEAFVMEYAWFCDGKSPWHLPDQSAANSEAYSSKLVAYNVPSVPKETKQRNSSLPGVLISYLFIPVLGFKVTKLSLHSV